MEACSRFGSVKITVPLSSGYKKYPISATGPKPIGIVIHHSLSEDRSVRDWDGLRNYHKSYRHNGEIITKEQYETLKKNRYAYGLERPWKDIGYHVGIEQVNGQYEIQKGRPIRSRGAHTLGQDARGKSFNRHYIGVCVVGNFDNEPPSESCLFLLRSVCRDLQSMFGISTEHIVGHRETFAIRGLPTEKSCPGHRFDMAQFREGLKGGNHENAG